MATLTATNHRCDNCAKAEATAGIKLKPCPRPHCSALYCNSKCRNEDWKQHKKACPSARVETIIASVPPTTSRADAAAGVLRVQSIRVQPALHLEADVASPFRRLHDGTWLHGRPAADVYKLLVDTFRLRMNDRLVFLGVVHTRTVGGVERTGRWMFIEFLQRARSKAGLLPVWWSDETMAECLEVSEGTAGWWSGLGTAGERGDAGQWSNDLSQTVDSGSIVEHYGLDSFMLWQLRFFEKQVYGDLPWMEDPDGDLLQLTRREEGEDAVGFILAARRVPFEDRVLAGDG